MKLKLFLFFLCLFGIRVTSIFAQPDTLWTYTYSSEDNDLAYTIVPTSDGGFVIGGIGSVPDSSRGAILIRIDQTGELRWAKKITGMERVRAIVPLPDNGWILAGRCGLDQMGIARTDSVGNIIWTRCIRFVYIELGVSIALTTDGRIAVLSEGSWGSVPDLDLACLSLDGDSLWLQTYGGAAEDHGGAVFNTEDEGFMLFGSQNHQVAVLKTDSMGGLQWTTTFGSPTLTEVIYSGVQLSNGDYIIAGTQARDAWTTNPYVVRVTPTGDTVWTRIFPEYGPGFLFSVCRLVNDSIVAVGRYNRDFLALYVGPTGDLVWNASFDSGLLDYGQAVCSTQDSGIAIAGYHHPWAIDEHDIWVVRTEPINAQNIALHFSLPFDIHIACYPNPFNASTQISFALPVTTRVTMRLYDVLGREVRMLMDEIQTVGEHRVSFDGSGLSSGVYLCRMQAGEFEQTRKIVLMK